MKVSFANRLYILSRMTQIDEFKCVEIEQMERAAQFMRNDNSKSIF